MLASFGWDMAVAQIGKSCGRFGKQLFPPLTLSLPTLCCYGLGRGHFQDENQVRQEKCDSLDAFSWYQHHFPRSPRLPVHSILTRLFYILSPLSLWLSASVLSVPPLGCSVYSWTAPECVCICVLRLCVY